MKKEPKNLRAIKTRCCWNCLSIRSDSDSWFCSRPQGPIWQEFDLPFKHICDLFKMREIGIIPDVDINGEVSSRMNGA